MPQPSLELLPDDPGDAVVRRDWRRLTDAGLPSQLDHRGPTNAPHVTVLALPEIPAEVRSRAVDLLGPLLPVEARMTGLLVLGERRRVLARLVEAPDLLVRAVLDLRGATQGHAFAGWLPHVTLAHGLDAVQVSRATALVDPAPRPLVLTSLRHWDPASRTVEQLAHARSV